MGWIHVGQIHLSIGVFVTYTELAQPGWRRLSITIATQQRLGQHLSHVPLRGRRIPATGFSPLTRPDAWGDLTPSSQGVQLSCRAKRGIPFRGLISICTDPAL